jgi:hypothetical protein
MKHLYIFTPKRQNQKVGVYRQFALAYKNAIPQDREHHLAILAEEAQRLDLGYTI